MKRTSNPAPSTERVRRYRQANPQAAREWARAYGQKTKERRREVEHNWRSAHPLHRAAWNYVYKAIRAGKLTRANNCMACGKECRTEAHHEDYGKPNEVTWLCKPCHEIADSKRGEVKWTSPN